MLGNLGYTQKRALMALAVGLLIVLDVAFVIGLTQTNPDLQQTWLLIVNIVVIGGALLLAFLPFIVAVELTDEEQSLLEAKQLEAETAFTNAEADYNAYSTAHQTPTVAEQHELTKKRRAMKKAQQTRDRWTAKVDKMDEYMLGKRQAMWLELGAVVVALMAVIASVSLLGLIGWDRDMILGFLRWVFALDVVVTLIAFFIVMVHERRAV